MRWQTETFNEKQKRLAQWRPWFAWRPIMIGNERVWLERVYRRYRMHYGPAGETYYEVEYADTMSILRKEQMMKDYELE